MPHESSATRRCGVGVIEPDIEGTNTPLLRDVGDGGALNVESRARGKLHETRGVVRTLGREQSWWRMTYLRWSGCSQGGQEAEKESRCEADHDESGEVGFVYFVECWLCEVVLSVYSSKRLGFI